MKYQKVDAKIKSNGNNTIEAIFSTPDIDRHGDSVKQKWDIAQYMKNPVILNSHRHNDAEEVIGKAVDLSIIDNKLQGKIEFAVKENPKAKVIYQLYKGGFLKAFSVGFSVEEINDKDDKWEVVPAELLEISAVSVPANAEALSKIKKKGIDVDLILNNKENDKSSNDDTDNTGNDEEPKDENGKDKETEERDEAVVEEEENEEEKKDEPETDDKGNEKEGDTDDNGESESEQEGEQEKSLNEIYLAVNKIQSESEKLKVDKSENLKTLRLINKSIRTLLKSKKNIKK